MTATVASHPMIHRGFTLIEMLVAIGILMLLMGLSVAAIMGQPKVSRLIASEQMLSDLIRQARHTAETTGLPVQLVIDPLTRDIGGVTRTPLWSRCDGWPFGAAGPLPGRTGTGLAPADAFAGTPYPAGAAVMAAGEALHGNLRVTRGVAATPPPSLVLSVWVRPPLASSTGPTVLPVLHVGQDVGPGDPAFASIDASVCGICLQHINADPSAIPPITSSWEVVGWVRAPGGNRIEITSLANPPADLAPLPPGTTAPIADTEPLVGGEWIQLGLLIDANQLVLYRQGRRIAQLPLATPLAGVFSCGGQERVFVGHLQLPGTPIGAPPADYRIDDVSIERLGTAMLGRLPGVTTDMKRTITCHPDGHVELDGGLMSLVVHGIGSAESATLTVSATGMVTTQIAP